MAEPTDSKESKEELLERAKKTAETVEKKDETEVLSPDPNNKDAKQIQTAAELDAALQDAELQAAEKLSFSLQIIEFIIVTGFGLLMILAIGAIIFYLLDWAASLFEFDLAQYTQWLILVLSGTNILMSCCGCYGTYKLSEVSKENDKRLKRVTAELQDLADGISEDNDELEETLRTFQVEIDHLNNENNETLRSLQEVEQQEADFLATRKDEATLFIGLRELWTLWKMYETYSTISRITKITAEYYNKAYQDGDTQAGLAREQYDDLRRCPVVPRKDRKFFPDFEHKVWKLEGRVGRKEDGAILVDEFERVLVLIYKNVLREELQVELSEQDKRRGRVSVEFTGQILGPQKKKKAGFFDRFFGD